MNSKEAWNKIKEQHKLYTNVEPTTFYGVPIETIENDLEVFENVKNKTNLFYSQRKQIAKEFNHWCVENNVDALDSTNLVTWLLCFKLKEWIKN